MNAWVLLCATILTADNPAQVQVKVLYGSGPRNERIADIDLWISQSVVKSGSPLALPHTGWIKLTDDDHRLYTSEQGGFIIDGKASEQNGKYKVEINGCEGLPLKETVTLRPGERRVVKLTDNPPPDNVFIALEAPLSEQAMKRADSMKANVATFRLELNYSGQEDKPFYRLIVSVPVVDPLASNPFHRIVQVNETEAIRIIDHLARDGFLDQSVDPRNRAELSPPSKLGYSLKVATGNISLDEDLGWDLPMLQRLDGLRDALPDTATKNMEFVLTRLSGLRKQWEAEQQPKTSLKGWELYIWRQVDETYFSLMVGTNRLKTDEEIAKSAVKGFEALKPKLDQLKKGEELLLHGRRLIEKAPAEEADRVTEYSEKIGLKAK